jgi:hypothetical protein
VRLQREALDELRCLRYRLLYRFLSRLTSVFAPLMFLDLA